MLIPVVLSGGAGTILAALDTHAPELLTAARSAWEASCAHATDEQMPIAEQAFGRCPEISLDYAVMEKAEGVVPLVMIEVQCGDYLGEDDIVRFEDVYGRSTNG